MAFGTLYRALTLTTGSKRRRSSSDSSLLVFRDILSDVAWAGVFHSRVINNFNIFSRDLVL